MMFYYRNCGGILTIPIYFALVRWQPLPTLFTSVNILGSKYNPENVKHRSFHFLGDSSVTAPFSVPRLQGAITIKLC